MRVVDYCSGAGGTAAGIRDAGGTIVLAVDSDPIASSTHTRAQPATHHLITSLEEIDPSAIPAHDVGAWSLPCQEFSWASGVSPRKAEGRLLDEFIRITEATLPQYVMFENVPGLLRWPAFNLWRKRWRALGYHVEEDVLQFGDWVDQERERLVMVGRRGPRYPQLPEPPRRKPVAAREIIDLRRGPWGWVRDRSLSVQARVVQARRRFGPDFLLSAFTQEAKWAGRSLDRPIGTITTAVHWQLVRGEKIRFLTPEETARAQDFPEGYVFDGGTHDKHRQIGNAYPRGMARAVFEALVT